MLSAAKRLLKCNDRVLGLGAQHVFLRASSKQVGALLGRQSRRVAKRGRVVRSRLTMRAGRAGALGCEWCPA